MRKVLTEEEKFRQMMEEPVQTLIPRLALPSMVSMIVVAVYNMADTFFVSQLGTSASGAVGIVYSMMAIIQAIAFMIGMGCGNEISRLLGAKKQEEAERFVAIGFFTELFLGTLIALFCIISSGRRGPDERRFPTGQVQPSEIRSLLQLPQAEYPLL